ncbi:unnamed protein product [Symbiodinium natans]|uniref:TFIIS N-terminal domain-containing protein n=1 Tax=Symbiodinium natans TaxID=878477 RepID=A0A812RAS0_9DINO|nr:unnamed protein product [Symbiodinium natans]
MATVLLPKRLCASTTAGLLRSRVLGPQKRRADWSDSEGTQRSEEDSDSDSAGSEANEYAEGLGVADRKRCCQQSASQFEFDHHPREEYFEEPKSYQGDASRCLEVAALHSADGSQRTLSGVLQELEVREAIKERCAKRRRLRAQRGQSAPGQPEQAQAVGAQARSLRPIKAPEAGLTQIRAYAACMAVLRQSPQNAPDEEAAHEALGVLNALSCQEIGKAELKATGIGRELAKAFWQQHRSEAIARLARGLVDGWRQNLRARG